MKYLAFALGLFLFTAAAAQNNGKRYLVRLDSAEFPASLRSQGIQPLHHAGKLWAVRAEDDRILRQTTEDVTPATLVTIELQPDTKDISQAVTDAGGVVTRTYQSIHAVAAILPTSRIEGFQRLPGVRRVRKARSRALLSGSGD